MAAWRGLAEASLAPGLGLASTMQYRFPSAQLRLGRVVRVCHLIFFVFSGRIVLGYDLRPGA